MQSRLKAVIALIICLFAVQSYAKVSPDEFSSPVISIGVVVEDLDKALDFYTNVIGMTEVSEFGVDVEKAKELGLSNNERFDVKVLKLENSEQATQWKLMTFGKKAKHPKQEYVPDDTGMQYITIFVKSMKPFIERIKKHNVKMLGKTPVMLNNDRQFVLVQDPDGTFIELIGPPK